MTDINEVLASIKQSNLALEEINQEFNSTVKMVIQGLENLNNPIEDLIQTEKKLNEEISQIESTNLSLTQEITSLKDEKTKLENNQSETQTLFNETVDKRTKLDVKIKETKTELDTTKTNLTSAKETLKQESEQFERISAEVQNIVTISDQQIMELEKKSEQKRDSLRKIKGERMALEYLIKRGHVEFNEVKIINALEGRKITDMTTITKVTGISENLIEKTLEGLMKRNLLTYDASSGAITITGSLKI